MADTLIQQGTDLMLMGMGTVFVFLATLVAVTTIMSKVVNRICPEEASPVEEPAAAATSSGPVDGKVLKIIQAAIDQHRGRK